MLGQPRTTQRRARKVASDEWALRGDIVRLASRFGRYGYRRVTDMLRIEGWGVNRHHPPACPSVSVNTSRTDSISSSSSMAISTVPPPP